MVKFFTDPTVWIAIGAVISAFASWRATKLQSDEADKLSKKLIDSQAEVIRLTQQINGYVTGGDSFCYIDMSYSDKSENILMQIIQYGKYALGEIEISLINTDEEYEALDSKIPIPEYFEEAAKWVKIKDSSETFTNSNPLSIDLKSIMKNERFESHIPLGKNRKQKSFTIRFKSKHAVWFERILLRQINAFPKRKYKTELEQKTNQIDLNYLYHLPDNPAICAFQVYTVEEIEINKNEKKQYEKIILEGTTRSVYFYDKDPELFQRVKWDDFPLRKEETNAFTSKGIIHWDGSNLVIKKDRVTRVTSPIAGDSSLYTVSTIKE